MPSYVIRLYRDTKTDSEQDSLTASTAKQAQEMLDQAKANNWRVISIACDGKTINDHALAKAGGVVISNE